MHSGRKPNRWGVLVIVQEGCYGTYLHLCNLWVHDAQPAATQAHHGVALCQALQPSLHLQGNRAIMH